jgi:hypothetical protein
MGCCWLIRIARVKTRGRCRQHRRGSLRYELPHEAVFQGMSTDGRGDVGGFQPNPIHLQPQLDIEIRYGGFPASGIGGGQHRRRLGHWL